METAQANDWTLTLMRHHTLKRNCHNVIMVEQKKARAPLAPPLGLKGQHLDSRSEASLSQHFSRSLSTVEHYYRCCLSVRSLLHTGQTAEFITFRFPALVGTTTDRVFCVVDMLGQHCSKTKSRTQYHVLYAMWFQQHRRHVDEPCLAQYTTVVFPQDCGMRTEEEVGRIAHAFHVVVIDRTLSLGRSRIAISNHTNLGCP